MHSAEILQHGLDELDLIDPALSDRLLRFLRLLSEWNRIHNLTAIDDPEAMVRKHLLDCLSVARYLPAGRILDIGTGAGLPGIPLALASPDRTFVLLDAREKKLRFVRHACRELALDNVTTVHARLEDYQAPTGFDGAIARAFAHWQQLARMARDKLKPGGFLLAMAGQMETDGPLAAPPGFDSAECIGLQVPLLEAKRHLIRLRRAA